jgi:hypothetical protein
VGISFVLLIWAIVGFLVACVGAVVLGAATAFATRGSNARPAAAPQPPVSPSVVRKLLSAAFLKVRSSRRFAIIAASAFPFVCLGWGGAVFFFQAAVNQVLLHRDPGLGDTWECPLPNGYALLMIDDTDHGWVYNPATQTGGGVGEQEDAVPGISVVQVAGRYILGKVDGKALDRPNFGNNVSAKHPDSFFLLDTQDGKRQNFAKYDSLVRAAEPLAIQPKLESIEVVYRHFRFTWFDAFAAFLFVVPPILGFFLLFLWVLYLR